MPKFNSDRWKPVDDSSPGYRTLDPTCVVLNVGLRMEGPGSAMGCPCGCGEFPMSDRTTFCMGHDARLRGILIRAHLMGVKVRYYMGGTLSDPVDAEMLAEQYHWKSYLTGAVMRREGKNREVLKRALGTERLVKVGRWEYTGQVVAVFRTNREDMYEIEYVNQAGDIKKIKVPADEAPLAREEEKV
jgi:hypothetical protein